MPLVKPKDKETTEDYIARCMSDQTSTSEYSNPGQRLAVCTSLYKNKNKEEYSMNDIEKMGEAIKSLTDVISHKAKKPKDKKEDDHFDREDAAIARAGEIGCTGTHKVDEDGSTFYMPCGSHEEYLEAVKKGKMPKDKEKWKSVCVCGGDGKCQCDTELKHVIFESEVKSDEKGIFTGYGSIFGNEDQGMDIMQKGAFAQSLKNRPPSKVKMLYQHKTDEPIGVFENIHEDATGLYVKGKLAMGTQRGREAYELLKMGALDGMSIGFKADPDKQGYNENKRGVRTLKEVDLMEISLVTFPMNESALIETVKGNAKNIREWERILREAGGLSRTEAKIGAKALSESLKQRDADNTQSLADLILKVANKLK